MTRLLTLQELAAEITSAEDGDRRLIAIAGPPGSGKSTFAEQLRRQLLTKAGGCEILPMDGFHYDDAVLSARGDLARKGAPHTFDVEGLHAALVRLKREGEVAVPVFDRSLEIARAGARIIEPSVGIVLVEGNYLLLKERRWQPLHALFDLTVMLDVPVETLETRLLDRWKDLDPEALRTKMEGNDLPNGRLVREESIEADVQVVSG